LVVSALELIADDVALNALSKNILEMAQKDSADRIVKEIMKLIK